MSDSQPDDKQPGDPEQLARVVEAAEQHYERSRKSIVVYWDAGVNRYRLGYEMLYKPTHETMEVVKIP